MVHVRTSQPYYLAPAIRQAPVNLTLQSPSDIPKTYPSGPVCAAHIPPSPPNSPACRPRHSDGQQSHKHTWPVPSPALSMHQ